LLFIEDKYILGTDSLVIRNFSYYDQGVYYCRAFITLKNNFLSKMYPILVQLQSKDFSFNMNIIYLFIKKKDSSYYINDSLSSSIENKHCNGFRQTIITNNTISYCNTDGYISNYTCPKDLIWNEDYSQCLSPLSMYPIICFLSQSVEKVIRKYSYHMMISEQNYHSLVGVQIYYFRSNI